LNKMLTRLYVVVTQRAGILAGSLWLIQCYVVGWSKNYVRIYGLQMHGTVKGQDRLLEEIGI
jgi:hypothetical protein